MSYLNILRNKNFFKVVKVDIENQTFYLRELSVGAKIDLLKGRNLADATPEVYADYFTDMVFACLCDENGKLTENPEEYGELRKVMPDSILTQLRDEVLSLNGLTNKDSDDLKKS